ncbi:MULTISPECIES: DUF6483 family protein [Clostridium]|uniref:Tetratricopeptide repeat protein n=1 Tax=Clostridium cibarium TaxID=2762247 RepID=A0ABR8PYH1_9CLOT|nr:MULTISPECIES: DUF6483 family protein [Clostridium]MBD7913164.1 hypothetical protein [Clostridium cibarium]
MFESDYMKRLIESIGKMLVAITSGKDAIESNIKFEEDNVSISEDGLLEIMVNKYVHEGKLDEAEKIIFEAVKSRKSRRSFEIALSFYKEISEWDESKLTKYNFSKKRIIQGLENIKKLED